VANTRRLRKIRRRLWENNPCCHWCGVKTVWWVEALGHVEKPKNAATLDHLISRLNPQRYQMSEYPSELMVIACDKCNNERGKREDVSLRRITEWNSRKELKEVLTDPNLMVHYLYE
jgi:5-methylcytosine-specific restriction endonuclease McrA